MSCRTFRHVRAVGKQVERTIGRPNAKLRENRVRNPLRTLSSEFCLYRTTTRSSATFQENVGCRGLLPHRTPSGPQIAKRYETIFRGLAVRGGQGQGDSVIPEILSQGGVSSGDMENWEETSKQKPPTKTYTMDEVARHNSLDSVWIVVEGKVYDVTNFTAEHPGGLDPLIMNAGSDATEYFLAIHSDDAKTHLKNFFIGDVAEAKSQSPQPVAVDGTTVIDALVSEKPLESANDGSLLDTASPVALNPNKWTEFPLLSKVDVSADTKLFTFKLPTPQHKLGLPVGFHMFVHAEIDGQFVKRPYTPVSSDDDLGIFTLCTKVYRKNVHPKFPGGGKLSQYMDAMDVGEMLQVKGPFGHFEYTGKGRIILSGQERRVKQLGLICGGSGITPAYQIMKAVCKDPEDRTEIFLVYANQTEHDILLRKELDAMAASKPNIHVWYTVDRAVTPGWTYSTGFVDEDMLRAHIPPAASDSFVAMCGPPTMINVSCIPNLKLIGYTEQDYMSF